MYQSFNAHMVDNVILIESKFACLIAENKLKTYCITGVQNCSDLVGVSLIGLDSKGMKRPTPALITFSRVGRRFFI